MPDNPTPDNDPLEDSVIDRRSGLDRRKVKERLGDSDTDHASLDRRRGPGRRRTDFAKAAEEGEMTNEQFLFLVCIDEFKRANSKAFPSWTDVLEVIRLLGYRKTAASEIPLPKGTSDWQEKPDTPSGVRDITNPSDR